MDLDGGESWRPFIGATWTAEYENPNEKLALDVQQRSCCRLQQQNAMGKNHGSQFINKFQQNPSNNYVIVII